MADEERIELNKLSQRELLILLHDKAQRLEQNMNQINHRQQQMALKVNTLETKSTVAGSVWGAIAGMFTAILTTLIDRLVK